MSVVEKTVTDEVQVPGETEVDIVAFRKKICRTGPIRLARVVRLSVCLSVCLSVFM
jgi:hypothetical protein